MFANNHCVLSVPGLAPMLTATSATETFLSGVPVALAMEVRLSSWRGTMPTRPKGTMVCVGRKPSMISLGV